MLRLPYVVRYLIALALWAALMAIMLLAKFALVYFLPFLWLASGFFNRRQEDAQLGANLVDFYIYKWPPYPRADWKRLLGLRRGGPANDAPQPRLTQEIGDRSA